jgi:aspartate/methionine/tyrosine aminotransferase
MIPIVKGRSDIRPVLRQSIRVRSMQSAIMQELQSHFTPSTLSLAQGVPFFPPPEEALSVLSQKIGEPQTHVYSPDAGLLEFREALSTKLRNENGISVGPERIMVTSGANQGFMNAVLSITDPGDEIILLRPYYFNHEMALQMCGVTPVMVDLDEQFQPDLEAIRKAISERTRAIVTVSPNNPTGAVYKKERLRAVNTLCKDDGIYHISDEPYEYFTFGNDEHYSPGVGGEDHTITLHSFSKSYGMPGWRIGYMSYPEELRENLLKIQDTLVICPSVVGQLMALECLKLGRSYVDRFLCVMREAREVMLNHLRELEGLISLPETSGGYYFYPKISSTSTGRELAIRLIRDHHVAVVPGEPFGSIEACHLRLSYGNVTPDQAEEGMKRFSKGVRNML